MNAVLRIQAEPERDPREVARAIAEQRLIQWAKDQHFEPMNVFPAATSIGRMMSEVAFDDRFKRARFMRLKVRAIDRKLGLRKRARKQTVTCKSSMGVRMEIVETDGDSVACPPDGGVAALVERLAKSLFRGRENDEVRDAYAVMPAAHMLIARAAYYERARYERIPRDPDVVAAELGFSRATYFRRRAAMLDWLAGALTLRGTSLVPLTAV